MRIEDPSECIFLQRLQPGDALIDALMGPPPRPAELVCLASVRAHCLPVRFGDVSRDVRDGSSCARAVDEKRQTQHCKRLAEA
jgi:hypothetical protein